jgi:Zn-dependent protease
MFFFQYLSTDPRFFFAMVITIVVSVCLHELAHGLVAVWLGDDTPIEQERMTLNPLVHMGPASLICLFLAGIAWGAMPVNTSRLRWRYGGALVAAAGPLTNILLATIALLSLGYWMRYDPRRAADLSQYAQNGRFLLHVFGLANVLLALFNLIPFPPLDGARILENFSDTFERVIEGFIQRSPSVYFQASILLFAIAGNALWPIAGTIAGNILQITQK